MSCSCPVKHSSQLANCRNGGVGPKAPDNRVASRDRQSALSTRCLSAVAVQKVSSFSTWHGKRESRIDNPVRSTFSLKNFLYLAADCLKRATLALPSPVK